MGYYGCNPFRVIIPGFFSNAEKTPLSSAYPFKLFIVKKENDNPIGLAGPFLGAPQAVIILEKLIAMGAKIF